MKKSTLIITTFLGFLCAQRAGAAATNLPLRYETNGVATFNDTSSQVIENAFGTNQLGLAFTGTNTYDFYSAPLTTAINFPSIDKIAGVIYITNSAPTPANDFSVSGSMQYYDYDPDTGVDRLIMQTKPGGAAGQRVDHRKMTHWTVAQAPGHIAFQIPAGHSLHIAVTLVLISGDPGSFARLLYNGKRGASTTAVFPKPLLLPSKWQTPSIVSLPPSIDSITVAPDRTVQLTGDGDPEETYLIQATTNLSDPTSWTTIGSSLSEIDGTLQFTDSDAANYSYRFYRLSTP